MLLLQNKSLDTFDVQKYELAIVFTLVKTQWGKITHSGLIHYETANIRKIFRNLFDRQLTMEKFKKESPVLVIFDTDSIGNFYQIEDLISSKPPSIDIIIASPKDFWLKNEKRYKYICSKEVHKSLTNLCIDTSDVFEDDQ